MGIQHELNVIRNSRKSLLHMVLLTSIVAGAVASASLDPVATDTSSSSTEAAAAAATASSPNIVKPNVIENMPTESGESDNVVEKRNPRPAIPFCHDQQERTIGRRLLYVSTLDGRLSALDVTKGGKVRWSLPTGPGPLISSSIHRLELTNNGQFVRMIPSLSGGIYKFDGESIDPIPITTDNLLSSSAKFSDDLVISGGKETRTYGVSARTGQMLYECSMNGCINATDLEHNATATIEDDDVESYEEDDNEEGPRYMAEHDPLVDDVIVVKRQTQTVRAVETRTGVERWNFSVGQHELDLIRSSECHDRKFSDMDMAVLDLDIKVIVPEGVICAFSKQDPSVMLWKYKFSHPIVSAWKIGAADDLESIDMFGSAQWLWNRDDKFFNLPLPTINPSIYLGMYEKQLYIQESVNMHKEIVDQSNLYSHLTTESLLPKIPWRPISASSNSLVIYQQEDDKIIGGGSLPTNDIQGNELVLYNDEHFALSAQSVLNASEYVNGNGFYLFTDQQLENANVNDVCDKNSSKNNGVPAIEEAKENAESSANNSVEDELTFTLDDVDAPVKVVILSLWYWWKEIVVIAFTSAVLLNLFVNQRNQERQIVVIERHIPVPTGIEATESSTVALLGPTNTTTPSNTNSKTTNSKSLNGHRTLSESTSNSGEHFSSRFQSDFDLMQCLGRGGFGVVFEAKNKLDDCRYAIKRITLPNKEESRMRVMREVKTLANCEHQNIVRYFQSWVEKPPPGWQEEEDSKWLASEMSTSIQIETPTDTSSVFPINNHLANNIDKKQQLQSWMESMNSTACSSEHMNKFYRNTLDDVDEDDDSCIIFRSESQSLALRDDDNDESTTEETVPVKGRRTKNHSISIDIHTNSIDLSITKPNRNIDYSQLSDSFQIEFVGSANGHEEDRNGFSQEDENSLSNDNKVTQRRKSRPKDLALTISSSEGGKDNNNCRELLPTTNALKPIQNKVYLYIQMQLCRKESLRDWLRDNVTQNRAEYIASIFHQIVDAVDYVHYKGLIHRDLKPSNIFFSQEGQIKIGDFGLVTDMADIPNIVTKCGDKTGMPSCARHTQQVGTHLYMSPEQLRGLHYDFKVDIYSLGLIFFELLVYFGTEMERIMTLRSLRDGVYPTDFPLQHPKEYELLKKMLSVNPAERPATTELKLQLNEILKLPELPGDSEAAALALAARRLSRSRTFSSSE